MYVYTSTRVMFVVCYDLAKCMKKNTFYFLGCWIKVKFKFSEHDVLLLCK